MKADPVTIRNWEKGWTQIDVRFYPAIIEFLGYNPLPEARTLGEAVRRQRLALGLTQEGLANHASVDPATVSRLEADRPRTAKRPTMAVLQTLGMSRGATPSSKLV